MRFVKSQARQWHLHDLVCFEISALRYLVDFLKLVFFFFAAYGDYNDATIEVANARNQKLVNWDFEYELFLCSPRNFFITYFFFSLYAVRETRQV